MRLPLVLHHSLHARLTGSALFFIVGTSVAMGIVGLRLTANFENSRFRENFTLLATHLARNAELGVLLENRTMLARVAENMLQLADVQSVLITSRDGQIRVKKERATKKVPGDLRRVSAPIVSHLLSADDSPFLRQRGQEEVVGQVTIAYSTIGLQTLKREMAVQLLVVAFLLSLVSVVIYWLLARAVAAPMQDIMEVARQVSRGRLDVRARGGVLQETQTLAAAFNEMLEALARQRKELEEAQSDLARQQALAEVGKFSMTVAHEIKNPLAIIKGSLDILKKQGTTVEVKEKMVDFLEEEVARINQLVEEFLLYARPREPSLRRIDVGSLLASIRHRANLMRSGRTGEVVFVRPSRARCDIRCDPHLLERALLNIIENGLDASGGKGVRVSVLCDPDRELLIRVIDQGPGVPEETKEKIFEPFFSTKARGTGLGLAIAKDIIEAHGGTVIAVPGESGGCFEVRLPL